MTDGRSIGWLDGKKIVFASFVNGPLLNIYTIGVDGSGLTQLTDAAAFETGPQWPQSGRIAFYSSHRAQISSTFRSSPLEAHGSNLTRLTDDPISDLAPSFGRGQCQVCQ